MDTVLVTVRVAVFRVYKYNVLDTRGATKADVDHGLDNR